MADQLVSERPAHALEEQRIVRVLEDAAMSLLLDVLEILTRVPLGRIPLAHVAEASREFGESLAVSALAEPRDGKMRGLRESGTRED
jgi:hypothetical protein